MKTSDLSVVKTQMLNYEKKKKKKRHFYFSKDKYDRASFQKR